MSNVPTELYALGLVQLMDQQNCHHFEIDMTKLDREASRGLSINIEITETKLIFSTGRCDCPNCVEAGGGRTQ